MVTHRQWQRSWPAGRECGKNKTGRLVKDLAERNVLETLGWGENEKM